MKARRLTWAAPWALVACFAPAAPSGAPGAVGAAGGTGGTGGGGEAGGQGGSTVTGPAPVCPSDAATDCALVESIHAGGTFTCAQVDDGTVRCFGSNDSGQLGDPSQPPGYFGVGTVRSLGEVELALGRAHGCALDASGLRCWGRNLVGQLATGDRVFRPEPTPPVGLEGPVTQVATEHSATCALSEGRVWCWGHALQGQGWISDDAGEAVDVPTLVATIDDAERVAVGRLFACALRADDAVWCWGQGEDGQLGRGDAGSDATPAPVVDLPGPVYRLASGARVSCALAGAPAELTCWGRMGGEPMLTPTSFGEPPAEVLDLQVGDRYACALLADGRVQCWGADTYGQLGSLGPASEVPLDVDGLTDAIGLAVGHHHACALRERREVVCWGRNHFGQLGVPGEGQGTPTPVPWGAQR